MILYASYIRYKINITRVPIRYRINSEGVAINSSSKIMGDPFHVESYADTLALGKYCSQPTASTSLYIRVQSSLCRCPPGLLYYYGRPRIFASGARIRDACRSVVRARLKAMSARGLRIPIRPPSARCQKSPGNNLSVLLQMLDSSLDLIVVLYLRLVGAQLCPACRGGVPPLAPLQAIALRYQ